VGETYVTCALASGMPAATRGRVLSAALAHLAAGRRTQATQQSQQPGPGTALASVVAALVDDGIPPPALVEAANSAAEALVLPVLEKVLCVLANISDMRTAEQVDDEDALEESSEEDDDDDDDDDDNDDDDNDDDDNDDDDNGDDDGDNTIGKKRKRKAAGSKKAVDMKKKHNAAKAMVKAASKSKKAKQRAAAGGAGAVATARRNGRDFVNDFVTKMAAAAPSQPATNGTVSSHRNDDVFVVTVAREAPLSHAAATSVLTNLLTRLQHVDVFELPAFIYQLLLLVSARGNAQAKRKVLRSVIAHFDILERSSKEAVTAASQAQEADANDLIMSRAMNMSTLRQIQGTTLLHIDFAVKQDPAMVSELNKLARLSADSPHSILIPFGFAILLALARASSEMTTVMGTIRDAIVRFDKEIAVRARNPFAAKLCKNDDPMPNPRTALLSVIESAANDGWDMVCEPLIHLALLLMDKDTSRHGPPSSTPSLSDLGIETLSNLFISHEAIRTEIIDQLVSRVVLREKSSAAAIATLSSLARRCPSVLLGQSARIKESIADLVTLPPWTSSALIVAYKPLFRHRPDLRDFAFLSLRKALFHRDPAARAVASTGFLCLMSSGAEDISYSVDAASVTMATGTCGAMSETIATSVMDEVAQPLRRALTHPPAIKALMYKEARRLVAVCRPGVERRAMCNALHDLLHPQAIKFMMANDAPFLQLDHCVNESTGGNLVEPLGDLIACLTGIAQANGDKPLSKHYLCDFVRKVASVHVRDFDISKEIRARRGRDCDDNTDDADTMEDAADIAADRANRNRARVLGGAVDALINVALSVEDSAHTSQFYIDTVFPLLRMREDVLSILKHLGSAAASDALCDLGGDADIEPSVPRSVGWFPGSSGGVRGRGGYGKNGKGSSSKAGGEKKGKGKYGTAGSGGGGGNGSGGCAANADLVCRFGSFGVLVSSSANPVVDLDAAVRCLQSMVPSPSEDDSERRSVSAWFAQNAASSDLALLSAYLRAVVKTRIEGAIDATIPKTTGQASMPLMPAERSAMARSIFSLVHFAMADFQVHRGQTGAQHSKTSVRALELVQICIKAIAVIYAGDFDVSNQLCLSLLPSGSSKRRRCERSPVVHAITSLEKVVNSLLEDDLTREADVVVRIISALKALFSRDRQMTEFVELSSSIASWALGGLLSYTSDDAGIMTSLATLVMDRRESADGLEAAVELARRVHRVLGDIESNDEDDLPDPSPVVAGDTMSSGASLGKSRMIRPANALQAVDSILDAVDRSLDDAEWCFARMTSFEQVASTTRAGVAGSKVKGDSALEISRLDKLERTVNKAEDAAQAKTEQVIYVLTELVRSSIAKWSYQERLVKAVTRCYKVLSLAAHAQARRRDDPRPSFMTLLDTAKGLAPAVWSYMTFLGTNEKKEEGVSGKAGASNASKEARIMPQVVYEVERFEKLLIAAQKHTKIPLLRGIQRNTARDYKINPDKLMSDKESDDDDAGGRLSVDNLLR
jgi:FANCI solenoid 2/FANCI solenoid 4/FANCI solenoid 1/FANCI helical domain 2